MSRVAQLFIPARARFSIGEAVQCFSLMRPEYGPELGFIVNRYSDQNMSYYDIDIGGLVLKYIDETNVASCDCVILDTNGNFHVGRKTR